MATRKMVQGEFHFDFHMICRGEVSPVESHALLRLFDDAVDKFKADCESCGLEIEPDVRSRSTFDSLRSSGNSAPPFSFIVHKLRG